MARVVLGCAVAGVVVASFLVRVRTNVDVPVYGTRPPVLALVAWSCILVAAAVTALAVAYGVFRWLVLNAWDDR